MIHLSTKYFEHELCCLLKQGVSRSNKYIGIGKHSSRKCESIIICLDIVNLFLGLTRQLAKHEYSNNLPIKSELKMLHNARVFQIINPQTCSFPFVCGQGKVSPIKPIAVYQILTKPQKTRTQSQ